MEVPIRVIEMASELIFDILRDIGDRLSVTKLIDIS
jgi:hypothetical protein